MIIFHSCHSYVMLCYFKLPEGKRIEGLFCFLAILGKRVYVSFVFVTGAVL